MRLQLSIECFLDQTRRDLDGHVGMRRGEPRLRQDDQVMASDGMSQSERCAMATRVAMLLVRNLSEALHERRIDIADSELRWLVPGQCEEGDGGIQLFPSRTPELMQYARENNFRPLGVVVLAENGDYSDFMNEDAIATEDLDFAKHLFHVHALFWCFCFPSTADQDAQT